MFVGSESLEENNASATKSVEDVYKELERLVERSALKLRNVKLGYVVYSLKLLA